jgi:fumarate hydratase class II
LAASGNFELNVFKPVITITFCSLRPSAILASFNEFCAAGASRTAPHQENLERPDARDGAQPAHRLRQRREDCKKAYRTAAR